MSAIYCFDEDKLRAAGARYVEAGSPVLRADGALALLLSAEAVKLRVAPAPGHEPRGITNDNPADPLPAKEQ